MRAIVYPAEVVGEEIRKVSTRPLYVERWSSWLFKSDRSITRQIERGLSMENHLNNGAYFRILVQSEDSPVPRYQLDAQCRGGRLQIL